MGLLDKVVSTIDKATGGFLGSISGESQQKDANAMAMKSWQLANDYNHPVQQMERLKAAGLNPNLVYGSGSVTGNTTGAPSLAGGGIHTPVESMFKGVNNIIGALQGEANLDNTKAQTQASVASAGASGAQAANLNAQTAINSTKAQYEEKALIADIDYKQALADKTRAEAQISQGEADLLSPIGGSKGASTLGSIGKTLLRGAKSIFGR